MGIQACFKTGLTIEDTYEKACKSGKFKVIPPGEKGKFLMLYSKQAPKAKVQIMGRGKVIVWCEFNQLEIVKEFLNKTLGDAPNLKPFSNPYRIMLKEGEYRQILETPLGLLAAIPYFCPRETAFIARYICEHGDSWSKSSSL